MIQTEESELDGEETDVMDSMRGQGRLCFEEEDERIVGSCRHGMEATLRSSLKKFGFGGRGTGNFEFWGCIFTKLSDDDAMEMVSTEESSECTNENFTDGTSPEDSERRDEEDKVDGGMNPLLTDDTLLDAGNGAHVTFFALGKLELSEVSNAE